MNEILAPNEAIKKLEAIFQKAESQVKEKKYPLAINNYIKLIFHAPNHWLAYHKLGLLLNEIGKQESALVALQRASQINPQNASIWVSLGTLYRKMRQHDQAYESYQKALELEPENAHALFNTGEMLLRINRTKECLEYFNRVLDSKKIASKGKKEFKDIRAISQWLRGVATLTMGDYEAAWTDYESRVNHPTTSFPELVGELWTGQSLKGKTIFLAYEQRFGDVIQFVRFVPKLVEMGAKVLLQVPLPLWRWFGYLEGKGVTLVKFKDPLPKYDYCQLVTSIPALLNYKKKEVDLVPYLDVDPKAEKPRLPMKAGSKLKVGLLWAGKPEPDRSIPLECYMPLLKHREVSFYSFQIGPPSKDLKQNAADWLIHDLSGQIRDFHDSSMLLKEMDLFITIDTAAVHQAGAMGIPIWLMLRFYSDWRWGMADQDRTAWYPTVEIFRQTRYGTWDEAATQLETSFAQWVSDRLKEQSSLQSPASGKPAAKKKTTVKKKAQSKKKSAVKKKTVSKDKG